MLEAKRHSLDVCRGEVNLGCLDVGRRHCLDRVVHKRGSGHGAKIVSGLARNPGLILRKLTGGWVKIQLGTEYKLIVNHYNY